MVSRYTILCCVLFLFSIQVYTQRLELENSDLSKIKVEELSDGQIMQIKQRAEGSGMTESQMKTALLTRGMSTSELNKLEERMNSLGSEQSSLEIIDRSRQDVLLEQKEDIFESLYTLETDIIDEYESESLIFGYDLFRNKMLTFEPSLTIPTPPTYQIGPGDQLIIDVWGASQQNYQLAVSPEGSIYIENLGPIRVSGLTIEQASERVLKRLRTIYSGLSGSGRNTYAELTLGNTRTIDVHIIGEVNLPGTFTLSSFASLFNALYASGGPTENGSFRNIELFRNNELIATLDVYDFLINGKQKNNIRLQDQDLIKVNPYSTRVSLTGEIKRPGIYELAEDETLDDLILFTGGFTDKAYQKLLTVYRSTDTERKIVNLCKEEISNFVLHDGDSIPVSPILNRFENRVSINGAIYRPGDYALNGEISLSALIQKAEGLREDAFLNRALIYRTRDDFTLEIIPVNLKTVLSGEHGIIPLIKDDVISISSIFDLREEYFIQIDGEVNEKGFFPYMENSSLHDIIIMAGGLKESASLSKVEVARRIKTSENESTDAKISEIFYFNIDKELNISNEASSFKLEPFDQIFIRKSLGFEDPQTIVIEGEVFYPGSYVLGSKIDRISDLIERAGGITIEAYPKGAKLIRTVEFDKEREIAIENLMQEAEDSLQFNLEKGEEQAIGINLTKILENPESKFDLFLQDGDKLLVPKEMQTVRLSGALLFPITVRYDRSYTFNKYIAMSGGFASNAKKSKAYVIYANGSVDKTKNFILFKDYPKIEPGAEIVVPQKPKRENKMSASEAVGISSALASMALIVVTIINSFE